MENTWGAAIDGVSPVTLGSILPNMLLADSTQQGGDTGVLPGHWIEKDREDLASHWKEKDSSSSYRR